jgi:uncharacterized membrane protein
MEVMVKTEVRSKLERWLPIILIVTGVIGVLMASIILQEKFALANDPNYKPSCSINPIISCGSVMQSDQAAAFGFPNPFIGMVGYPILVVTGVLMLAGAATAIKRWYWVAMNIGLLLGVAMVHWLFFQSVFRIQALCPFCMGAWVVTITAFWYVTLYNLQKGNIVLPAKLKKVGVFIRKHHLDLLVLWFLIIAGLILHHFWYYFGRNLPF